MNDETPRTAVLQRIANLRAKASDEASTEAEAEAAMLRAEKMMHAYRVDEAELALAESEGRVIVDIVHAETHVANGAVRHKVAACIWNIARATNTKAVLWTNRSRTVEFTGDAPDVAYALYLMDLIKGAMDRGYASFRRSAGLVGTGAKANFQIAMARVLNDRLADMHREAAVERAVVRQRARSGGAPTGTDLVLVTAHDERIEATEAAFAKRHPRLGKAAPLRTGSYNHSAASAGRAAGAKLGLGRGVGSNSVARIGGR